MEIQKFEYIKNEKSLLYEIKSIFHKYLGAVIWWKNEKIANTSFNMKHFAKVVNSLNRWLFLRKAPFRGFWLCLCSMQYLLGFPLLAQGAKYKFFERSGIDR